MEYGDGESDSKHISKSITDIWSGGGSPLAKLGNAFKEFGKGALSAITATLLTPVMNAMTNLAVKIGSKLTDAISGAVIGGLTKVFGGAAGSAASSAVTTVAFPHVAGAVIPGAAGAASGAAGLGMMGAMGPVGIGMMGAQVAMGVIQGIQTRRTNKLLDLIEKSTRFSMLYLGERSDGGIVSATLRTVEYLGYVNASLDQIKGDTGWINQSLDQIKGNTNSAGLTEASTQMKGETGWD